MTGAGADERDAVLLTEGLVVGRADPLAEVEGPGPAKALLVRSSHLPWPAVRAVYLEPVTSAQHWRTYSDQRVLVEAGFGVDESGARQMVDGVRERTDRLGMTLLLARDAGHIVGGVAAFTLPAPRTAWARLQEVDVFPAWRGRGYGDALLSAVLALLAGQGVHTVVVGADEDDWPLSWYQRRGFHQVTRTPLTR